MCWPRAQPEQIPDVLIRYVHVVGSEECWSFTSSSFGRVDTRLRDEAEGKAAASPLETGQTPRGNGSDNDRHL